MSALLQAEGLSIRRGARVAVRDVSLELRAGEVVALLGPNGAGKSTLLDCLAGALEPTAGSVTRSGRVALALQASELARRSVLANVELGLAWWGVPRGGDRRQRALAALRTMGVEALAGRPALSLSGGERRRVHLARVLAVEPDILLLDEPFAGLDGESRWRLLEDSMSVLRRESRATMVVVHDRAEAWALADRLLVLIDGSLVAAGSPQDVLDAPPSVEVARFLGYDGQLMVGQELVLTRTANVLLASDGELEAVVNRAIAVEDGVRLELRLDAGTVYAASPWPAPAVGDRVRLRLTGGARFPPSGPDMPSYTPQPTRL